MGNRQLRPPRRQTIPSHCESVQAVCYHLLQLTPPSLSYRALGDLPTAVEIVLSPLPVSSHTTDSRDSSGSRLPQTVTALTEHRRLLATVCLRECGEIVQRRTVWFPSPLYIIMPANRSGKVFLPPSVQRTLESLHELFQSQHCIHDNSTSFKAQHLLSAKSHTKNPCTFYSNKELCVCLVSYMYILVNVV